MKYYVYKTTNLINGKIYIGHHGSDDIEHDSYMGSGDLISAALKKYGLENFKREILFEFNAADESYKKEQEIVDSKFIDRDDTYNLKAGGVGSKGHTRVTREQMSESQKAFWNSDKGQEAKQEYSEFRSELWKNEEYRDKMIAAFNTDSRKEKVSNAVTTWIKENPELHKERMNKINKNPEKIRKTAEKQIGRAHTEERKKNISLNRIGKAKGSENHEFKGYYITPFGKFDSLDAAAGVSGCSKICVRDRCRVKNSNLIVKYSVIMDKTKTITEDMIGKSWKDCGWSFEEV